MTQVAAAVVETTRDYYNSDDADHFYFQVWGGEDIHVGMYDKVGDPIREASQRTVRRMIELLDGLSSAARVLDIGSGYGGSARVLARQFGCHVTALNLATVQNQRAREFNTAQGLDHLVEVLDGSFEELPFADASYDIVWCQDAILHSARRQQVFAEVNRVLTPGGQFILTDPMQKQGADPVLLAPVLERIHLPSMGSIPQYRQFAMELGWEERHIESLPQMLVRHYASVLQELEERSDELAASCSHAYQRRMRQGLEQWVEAGEAGALDWGILQFSKPQI
jgi:sarcosine/dimethylglycine N-methyltransferase